MSQSLSTLLTEIRTAGVKLWVDNGQLRFDAPKGVMTPGLRARLRQNKTSVIDLLAKASRDGAAVQEPIPVVSRGGSLPLSYSQERLWFLDRLEPEQRHIYNIRNALRLIGALDVEGLAQAVEALGARQEALRTAFVETDGQPGLAIDPELRLRLARIDLSETVAAEREAALTELLAKTRREPFDLARAPLARFTLVKLARREHVLIVILHHAIADEGSLGLLIRELSALYRRHGLGERVDLPPLSVQYADFAHWQRRRLTEDSLARQLAWWKESLSGAPPLLELPTDRVRPAVQSYNGDAVRFKLDERLAAALRELARRAEATLYILLETAFAALLARYSGQRDIVVGTAISHRGREELSALIGLFLNTLAIRNDVSGDPSFIALLGRTRDAALDAFAHQDIPFLQVVEAVAPERDRAYAPIFQVMFDLRSAPSAEFMLSELRIEPMIGQGQSAKYDLTLSMVEADNRLTGYFEYNTDLFDRAAIERMRSHFKSLLEAAVSAPDQRLSQLLRVSSEERRMLLEAWNAATATASDAVFPRLFERRAKAMPDAAAVRVVAGENVVDALCYGELNARANRLARHLRELGAGPEVLVGVCLPRSPEMIIALLAVLKVGAAYLPLSPEEPEKRLAYQLGNSGIGLLATSHRLIDQLPAWELNFISVVVLEEADEEIAVESAENLTASPDPVNSAYVIYTSGSTGPPKGTVITHQGLANYLRWAVDAYGVEAGEGAPLHGALGFDATVTSLWAPLAAGQPVLLLPEGREVDSLALALQRFRFSLVKITPAHLDMLSGLLPEEASVRPPGVLVVGGEALTVPTVARWRGRAPESRIVNEYGPTETVVGSCVYEVSADLDAAATIPIGRPIDNMPHYLLDGDGALCPPGIPGELYIAGPGLARGYLARQDLTAARFVPNPFAAKNGDRMYKTGDRARWTQAGQLEFLGRLDQQIKLRGFRIEPGEIEAVLETHPDVVQCTVVRREDKLGRPRLVAYLTGPPADDGLGERIGAFAPALPASRTEALRDFLAEQLPEYMLPALFVELPALPVTRAGKVDRAALPAPLAARSSREPDQPRSPVQEVMTAIWAEVLDAPRVGVFDNFFELGGHSLLATQVISRIRDTFKVELGLESVFEHPTPAGMSECVQAAQRGRAGFTLPPLEPAPAGAPPTLSYAQQRLWFLHQLQDLGATYNIPFAWRLEGELRVRALEAAVQALAKRHQILRATFASVDGEPVLRPGAAPEPSLAVIDLQGLADPETLAAELIQLESLRRIDLAVGPLFYVKLLRLDHNRNLFITTLHHIISDEWSREAATREILTLYDAYASGVPEANHAALAPRLPVQYTDYAWWQRQSLENGTLEPQLAYWREQLADAPRLHEIPTDRPRPRLQTFEGSREAFTTDGEIARSLVELCRKARVTMFMCLEAAFATLIFRHSGQRDVMIGSPIANRARKELEPLIGFFANTMVMRNDLTPWTDDSLSFLHLLERVRQTALEAYARQDIPFEKIVERLQPERDLSHSPLFQILFAMQNVPERKRVASELQFAPTAVPQTTTKFDLSLYIRETAGGLRGSFEYNTRLFDRSTIQRMAARFVNLLRAIGDDPALDIRDLPLIDEHERKLMLEVWNQTDAAYPDRALVHHLVEMAVARAPEAVALTAHSVEGQVETLAYRELNRRANLLARRLLELGAGPETLIGIRVQRGAGMVVGLLAILKTGAAYVPIDPEYPPPRQDFIIQDSKMRALLVDRSGEAPPGIAEVPLALPETCAANDANPDVEIDPANLAYMIYTSGSTGKPKGVQLSHGSVVNLLASMGREPGLEADDVLLALTTISFDISVLELFLPLIKGARLAVADRETAGDPKALSALIESCGVTVLQATPATWRMLLDYGWRPPKSLTVISGGEALPKSLSRRLEHGGGLVWNVYGPTETTIWSTAFRLGMSDSSNETVSIGKPIANTQAYIVDERLRIAPAGAPGELALGGAGLARGYRRQAGLTASRFVPDPFGAAGARLYRTGDLARFRSGGFIEFLGRLDHQVKLRGFRIELGEIEVALAALNAVVEAVVVLREDRPGDKRLVAYFKPRPDCQAPTSDELRQALRDSLPSHMTPAAFVALDAMPLTPNGKIDRNAMPAPQSDPSASADYAAPTNQVEKALVQIWSDVLGVPAVGVNQNFFELGGHSLIAAKLMFQVSSHFSIDLGLRHLFETPTVTGLANRIDQARADLGEQTSFGADYFSSIEPDPTNRCQPFPLTEVQMAYWIGRSDALALGQVATHLYREFESVNLDLARLEKAVRRLIQRHDMLRAYILPSGEQVVLETVPDFRIPVIDLSGLDRKSAEREGKRIRNFLAYYVVPTDRWPLFDLRATLFADRARLHPGLDSILVDAWSSQILAQELIQFYTDPSSSLPPLELRFRDYVLAEAALQETPIYQRARNYWLERLDTLPPPPQLPLARDPKTIAAPRFRRYSLNLEPARWSQLKDRAARAGLTQTGVCLAAFAEALSAWCASPNFTINLTLFNRNPRHPDVNRIVGDFTSLTLLEINNSRAGSFTERAQRLQSQLWSDLDHRHFGGVSVQRELSSRRGARVIMPVVLSSTLGMELDSGAGRASEEGSADQAGQVDLLPVYGITQTPQIWLDHQISESNKALAISWDVVEDLFPEGLASALFEAFAALLDRLVDSDEAWLAPDVALAPEDQRALFAAANATEEPLPQGLMFEPFLARAVARGEALAAVDPASQLDYSELYREANTLAHCLRGLGAQSNELVAIMLEKGVEQAVAALAIQMAGAAYLPISVDLPDERKRLLLAEGACRLAVTRNQCLEGLDRPDGLQTVCLDGREVADLPPLRIQTGPDDLAYVIFTSGSTGKPKGVAIEHRAARNTIDDVNRRFDVGAEHRALGISDLGFDLSVFDIFGLLAAGGAVIFPAHDGVKEPSHWVELMIRHSVNFWNSVPALMQMLVEYLDDHPDRAPAGLALALLSGDWIPLDLPDRMKAVWPGLRVISLGGATEASIWSNCFEVNAIDPAWKSVPYGKPLANQRFYVLNELMATCPVWAPGRLYIGGAGLAREYWRDEEKTQAAFTVHPETGERIYHTGDLGRYLPDGNLEFLGRADHQVKIQGHRIELGEIEAALSELPEIRRAVVAAIGKDRENKRLAAYIQPERTVDVAASAEGAGNLEGGLARLQHKLSEPGLRKDLEDRPRISLGPPLEDDNRQSYYRRQSHRAFGKEPIATADLGALLACLSPIRAPGYPFPKYRYPSAGNLYPVQTYIYTKAGRVGELEEALYYYHPVERALRMVSNDPGVSAKQFGTVNAPVFEESAFALILVARLSAIEPLYGEDARDFCLIEAGYMGQLLMEAAPESLLGMCPVGKLEFAAIRARLGLDEDCVFAHAFLCGSVTEGQMAELRVQDEDKRENAQPVEDRLRAWLERKLPRYMIPSVFLTVDRFPLTATGKIDRRRLPRPEVADERAFVSPQTSVEATLAEIWAEILELDRVSAQADFFSLGGSSLHAIRVTSGIQARFGAEVSLKEIFERPTIQELAAVIEEKANQAVDEELPVLALEPEKRYEPFDMTEVQQAYWLGRQGHFELGEVATHGYFEIELERLDLALMNQVLRKLIERHDMLRVVIRDDGKQVVLKDAPAYDIAVADLRNETEPARDAELERIRRRMSHHVFDPAVWPLFEVRATRVGEGHTRLHVGFDLLFTDAWSLRILQMEAIALYHEPQRELTPLTLTFRDYLSAMGRLRDSERRQRARRYWLDRAPGMPPSPALPLSKGLKDLKKPSFERFSGVLEAETWQRLKRRARDLRVTPPMAVMTAFAEALRGWSQSPDFTVNLTLFNRLPLHSEVNRVVGDFTSLTLLAVEGHAGKTLAEKARALQQRLWEDLEHRLFSGVEVLRELSRIRKTRVLMPVVFTSVMLDDDQESADNPEEGQSAVQRGYGISQTSQVYLDHQVTELRGRLHFIWDALPELFPAGMLRDMFNAFEALLRRMAGEDAVWSESTPCLTPESQLRRLARINNTEAPLPAGLLHDGFFHHAAARPDRPALVGLGLEMSYAALAARAGSAAAWLRQLGVLPNTLVGVVMEKGWEQVAAVMGILQAGAAYLPVDPSLPWERRELLLREGRVELALTQSHLRDQLDWPEGLDTLAVDEAAALEEPPGPETRQAQTDLAYVIFTSGSTGDPKGVAIDHRGALNTVADINARFDVGENDRVLAVSSLSFDLSVYDLFGLLSVGGALALPNPAPNPDPDHWGQLIRAHRVTIWNSVPALLQILVEAGAGAAEPNLDLRLVLLSGDWIPLDLPDRIDGIFPNAVKISMGGATEASIWSIIYPFERVKPDWKSVPYGRPMINQRFHVLDSSGNPRPDWVPGELYIGGEGLARGYWGDEEKTRQRFIVHPHTGERLYRTGDLGRWLPEGVVEFLGREDFQVKIGGRRIELGEIEHAIARHPDVREAVVNAVGERMGAKQLLAYLIPEREAESELFATKRIDPESAEARWQAMLGLGAAQLRRACLEADATVVAGLWRLLDELHAHAVASALISLGVFRNAGERLSLEGLISRARIGPDHAAWLRRALTALTARRWLVLEGGAYANPRPLPEDVPSRLARELAEAAVEVPGVSGLDPTEGLAGPADLIGLLVGSGEARAWSGREPAAILETPRDQARQAVIELVVEAVEVWPADRTMRILEVGAGVSGIPDRLLSMLPEQGVSYDFTDISRHYLNEAAKGANARPFVRFETLNLERSPTTQGFEEHGYDLIIAANVLSLHRNIHDALSHARLLLGPGGVLVMIETVAFSPWLDLCEGLKPGWRRFEDRELRPEHPLLTREQWMTALETAGFVGSEALDGAGALPQSAGVEVILARNTVETTRFCEEAMRGFLRERLPEYMLPDGFFILDVWPLTANGKVDRKALPVHLISSKPEHRFVAPNGEIECRLAALYSAILSVARVGARDNFFDLGGDSLSGAQLIAAIREKLSVHLPLRALFENPCVADLARKVEALPKQEASPLDAAVTRVSRRGRIVKRKAVNATRDAAETAIKSGDGNDQ